MERHGVQRGGPLAAILVLVVAMATPVHMAAEKFQLDVSELGWDFTEDIYVDVEANTITMEVPHHNDVDTTTYVYDFNKNLTLRYRPESKECFLSAFESTSTKENMPEPRELMKLFKAAQKHEEQKRDTSSADEEDEDEEDEEEIQLYNWALDEMLDEDELEALSPVMRKVCPHNNIQWLFELHDSAHVRAGRKHRLKGGIARGQRSGVWSRRKRAPGPRCKGHNLKYRCLRKKGVLCSHGLILKDQYYQTCNQDRANCRTSKNGHKIDHVFCCRDCCASRSEADLVYPYCGTFMPTC